MVGAIPEGQYVLHRCDNRKCVNPSHLFLGNADDNAKDRLKKGRYKPVSKLGADEVRAIRAAYERGEKQQDIAERFGVQNPAISKIVNLRNWAHVS